MGREAEAINKTQIQITFKKERKLGALRKVYKGTLKREANMMMLNKPQKFYEEQEPEKGLYK